jgi:predicted metal-dependent hydrolase
LRVEGATSVYALALSGAVGSDAAVYRALRRFSRARAETVLPPWARAVAEEAGASPRSVSVCSTRTRWGQCDRAGNIKLDFKVLFFPPELARQVVCHELAHLQHMDHSARFYQALYALPGATPEYERAVKRAMAYVPAWAQGNIEDGS